MDIQVMIVNTVMVSMWHFTFVKTHKIHNAKSEL